MTTTAPQGMPVIWVINHYTTIPSKDGAGHRHYRLAQEISAMGWTPVLFLASTRHPSGEQSLPRSTRRRVVVDGNVSCVLIRTPAYRAGLGRLWNMGVFAMRMLTRATGRNVPKPDVVIGCTVHLMASWAAMRLARRHQVPFVFEMRDIWPETLIDLGVLKPSGVFARATRRLSRYLCKNADLVISPLPGVRSYLDQFGLGHVPFRWISNGIDLAIEGAAKGPSREHDDFTLMYLGSHGNANGLRGLLDAFNIAAEARRNLRLRLVGDGTQKKKLREYAATLPVADRITFEDPIPRGEVPMRARSADALVVNIEDLSVYRFGISLNKLFDYLASGRPTIIATSAVNNPIAEAQAGITVHAGDVDALARAMGEMSETSPKQRAEMGHRGAEHVRQNYTFAALAGQLAQALNEVVKTPRHAEEE